MKENRVEQPDDQLGFLLMQTSWLKQRIVNAALKELDITYIQFVILAGIRELDSSHGIVTQQLLASERRLDKAMVSNVVKTLLEKDFIQREMHPSDSRAWILKLTTGGNQMAIRAKEVAQRIDDTFFSGIPKDELRNMLKKILTDNTISYEK